MKLNKIIKVPNTQVELAEYILNEMGILEEYLEENEKRNANCYDSIYEMTNSLYTIVRGFRWEETPQGDKYWGDKHEMFLERWEQLKEHLDETQ